jgi:hypothetical protein
MIIDMKYQVRALKMPQDHWVAEYIEPAKTSSWGGATLAANPVRLTGYFATEEEANAHTVAFLKKENGATDEDIVIRKAT